VISAAAGQRHAQRAQLHGATRVIPYGELEQQIESVVQEIAGSSGLSDADVHPPGWVPPSSDQGYDLESMDLNVWLSIPGNRRLLGMQEESTSYGSATASAQAAPRATPQAFVDQPAAGDQPGNHEPNSASLTHTSTRINPNPLAPLTEAAAPSAAFDGARFQEIVAAQSQHNQQNASIAENILGRERDIRAELKREFLQAVTAQIATSEAKLLERIDKSLANTTRDAAAAIGKVKLMAGVLAGAAVLLVLAAIGVVWTLGTY
jgi:hypothetical protein